jgi:hypothetical protein
VLREASNMNWKADVKVLVVIGDAEPHPKGYKVPNSRYMLGFEPTLHIDWKNELTKCKDKCVTIFSCHAMPDSNTQAIPFYTKISSDTGGYYFPLDELQAFKDYMVAICMRAADGADDMLLLKQRQSELLEKMKNAENEEVKRNIEIESQEVEEAIIVAQNEGIFTSPSSQVATNIRSVKKMSTRVEKFETELNATTPSFFKNRSSTEFLNVIQNKSSSFSSSVATPLTPRKSKTEDEIARMMYAPKKKRPTRSYEDTDDF